MRVFVKDKKRVVPKGTASPDKKNEKTYTKADLERLHEELKTAKEEKANEDKKIKDKVVQYESQVKSLQEELN